MWIGEVVCAQYTKGSSPVAMYIINISIADALVVPTGAIPHREQSLYSNPTCFCIIDALVVPTGATPHREPVLSYGSSVLIIIAVSLTIGLGVLVIGLCCLRT